MTPEAVYALALATGLTRESAIIATAIAWGENEKLDPQAIGDEDLEDDTYGPSVGIWQIRSLRSDRGTGGPRDELANLDPKHNAMAMFVISGGGRTWTPWSVYKTGAYLRHLDAVRAAAEGAPMAIVRGGSVLPHVQAFANAVSRVTGAESFGTYPGHSPSIDRALDIFVPVDSRTLGDAICTFALENLSRFGIDYVIYRQHIYNPEIATYWRLMEDRGGVTQNHFDHVHVSFEATAAAEPEPGPEPEPTPQPEEPEVAKIAYPRTIEAGDGRRRIPVPAIGGGFGWTHVSVSFASADQVTLHRPIIGPYNERPLHPSFAHGVGDTFGFSGRDYIDLATGDEWIEIEVVDGGALELMIEASDG